MATTEKPAKNASASPVVTRGAFIVLEGLDRSGKSTQVALLEKRLLAQGKKVKVMRFPGRFLACTGIYLKSHWTWTRDMRRLGRADEDENAG